MNLKDRMKSDLPNSNPTEIEKPSESVRAENLNDTTQKSKQPSTEMELLEKQSEALKQVTEQRDRLLKEGRPEDQKKIQKLLSEKSELTSAIAELRTELSETQNTNQCLSTNNRILVKQNDDLRNSNGLKSKKEQSDLMEEVTATRDQNAKLKEMVSKSSVEAVDTARAERDQAIRDKKEGIRAAESKAWHETYEAEQKQKKAEDKAKEAAETLERRSFLYIGLLAFTLLCCAVMNSQVVSDFLDFFKVPALGIYDMVCEYSEWLIGLSDQMEIGWAWVVRILVTLLIIAIVFGIACGIIALIQNYNKRWCILSLKVMVITLAIIAVFGEQIRKFVPVNLILLFFLVQIGYLIVLWYFDGFYANRYRSDEWERIQNS